MIRLPFADRLHMPGPIRMMLAAGRRAAPALGMALLAAAVGQPLAHASDASQPPGAATGSSPFAAFTAPANEVRTPQVTARLLVHAPQGVAAGKPLWLGLQLAHQPHWHTYWKNPGDSGEPTRLQWTLPAGLQAGDTAWPAPSKLPVSSLANYGYDGTVLLPAPVQVTPELAAPGGKLPITLEAHWLVCKKECLPQQGRFTLDLPVGGPITANAPAFDAALAAVPQALSTAKAASAPAASSAPASITATLQGQQITFGTNALPATWRGKPVNLYPETPEITMPAAAGEQRWQGSHWQITLPLNPLRSENPAQLPVVLALQGAPDPDGVQRNAPGTPNYRAVAQVQGDWPPAQAKAGVSPELAAVLKAQAAGGGVPGAPLAGQSTGQSAPTATTSGMTLWLALGGALLGGLILNLMPCVFPVLAIKVLGFAKHAHSPAQQRISGLAYTAGVVLSFVLLAALLLALRAAGQQLGWGFQLQNPYLVAALAALFTALGLNLIGVFHIGNVLPGAVLQAVARHPVADAFVSGALAVLVAAPCTAPFMGAALGFAVGQPAVQALAVFAVMGLGLALPVLLGSLFPAALRWLPRPGGWMDVFKRLMAFPMFATVIWLVWVLGHQSGINAAAALLALLLAGSGLLWALTLHGKVRWWLAALFAATLAWLGAAYGSLLATPDAAPAGQAGSTQVQDGIWQPWSAQRVQQALAQGQPVFVDYTAAWCVTCQVNKKMVLSQPAFVQAAQAKNVLLLRADWTRSDPAITQSLTTLGRSGVPVYALYSPKVPQRPVILSELLTMDAVQQALQAL